MKRILFFLCIATASMYSCKKDSTSTPIQTEDTTTTKPTPTPVYGDTLTTQVKVGYGTNVTGTLPATATDANRPVLDSVHTQVYKAVKGGLLIVKPTVLSGTPAGYYVQIAGANSYFKVDYTKAYNLRKAANQKGLRTTGGIADSVIVIKLPDTIKVDSFSVKYAAYDAQNHVSNVVAEKAVIVADSTPTPDPLFATWHYIGSRHSLNGQYTDEWRYDTATVYNYAYYTCVNEKLVASDVQTALRVISKYYVFEETMTFTANTAVLDNGNYTQTLDVAQSSCSNYIYTYAKSTYEEPVISNMSYDAATKKLVLTYDASSDLGVITYTITELTATTLILSYPIDDHDNPGTDPNHLRYIKLIK